MKEERENVCLNCLHRRKYEWQNGSGYGSELLCIEGGRVKRIKNHYTCAKWHDDFNALMEIE